MSEELLNPKQEDVDQKNLNEFLESYEKLTKKHRLMIAGELVRTNQGSFIKPVVLKKPDESGK